MTNDPVQMLLDAGAIPQSPFGPLSRYASVAIVRYQPPHARTFAGDEAGIPYLRRRFAPRRSDITVVFEHTVRQGDRVDLLAAHYLGDVELHWRVADANPSRDMLELTATPGDRVLIPTPPGGAT